MEPDKKKLEANSEHFESPMSVEESDKRHRFYFLTFSFSLCFFLLFSFFFILDAIFKSNLTLEYTSLLKYQKEKVSKINELDLGLFGDSTLGNSIDTKQWSLVLNNKTYSFALTGDFGYSGSYVFLNKVKSKKIKNLIIFNSITIMARPSDLDSKAIILSSESFKELFFNLNSYSDLTNLVFSYDLAFDSLKTFFLNLFFNDDSSLNLYSENDYVPQYERYDFLRYKPEDHIYAVSNLKEDKIYYLELISEECRSNKLNCYYAHGPVYVGICESSKDYIEEINKRVQSLGFKVLSKMPYCLEKEEVGDGLDHVGPPYKAKVSRWYLDRYLKQLDS